MGDFLPVSVVALMEARGAAEVRSSRVGCDGPLAAARDRRCVVGEACGGQLTDVAVMGHDVGSGQHGRLLQVAVSEVPLRIVSGYDPGLDVGGERCPPEEGRLLLGENDTPHSHDGCIIRTDDRGLFWDHLRYAGGPGAQVVCEALEVVEVGSDVLGDFDAPVPRLRESQLEGTEETRTAGDADGHEAELADNLLPLTDAHSALPTEGLEDAVQALDPMWR